MVQRVNTISDTQRASDLFTNGLDAYKAGDYARSADLFGGASRLRQDNARYISYLGLAVSHRPSRFAEAREFCEKAVEMEPFNPELYLNLAEVYRAANIKDKAMKIYEDVLKIDPANDIALMNINKLAEESVHNEDSFIKKTLKRWRK